MVLGEAGVLIRGGPGSGKSTLALAACGAWNDAGRFARLVADDRVLLERCNDALIAAAPPALAGCCEVRGTGIVAVRPLARVRVRLVLDLVPTNAVPRLPEPQDAIVRLCGLTLPRTAVEARSTLPALLTLSMLLDAHGLTRPPRGPQRQPTGPRTGAVLAAREPALAGVEGMP